MSNRGRSTSLGRSAKLRLRTVPQSHRSHPVPTGMRTAAAWSWRVIIVFAAIVLIAFIVSELRLVVIPLLLAVVLASLLVPFSEWLQNHHWPKWLSVAVTELSILGTLAALIYLVVTQVVGQFDGLRTRALDAYRNLQTVLESQPFAPVTRAVDTFVDEAANAGESSSGELIDGVFSAGLSVGHLLTGMFLVLFCTLFMLIDGSNIWAWIVRADPDGRNLSSVDPVHDFTDAVGDSFEHLERIDFGPAEPGRQGCGSPPGNSNGSSRLSKLEDGRLRGGRADIDTQYEGVFRTEAHVHRPSPLSEYSEPEEARSAT